MRNADFGMRIKGWLVYSRGYWTQFVGPGRAAGDARGQVEGQEAFADAGVADQERDITQRNSAGPQPMLLAVFDVTYPHRVHRLHDALAFGFLLSA